MSLEDFTMDESRLDDRFVHLTNASVQKHHPEYKVRSDKERSDELRERVLGVLAFNADTFVSKVATHDPTSFLPREPLLLCLLTTLVAAEGR